MRSYTCPRYKLIVPQSCIHTSIVCFVTPELDSVYIPPLQADTMLMSSVEGCGRVIAIGIIFSLCFCCAYSFFFGSHIITASNIITKTQ